MFEKKTILISVPYHFGLPQRFKENLEFLGFNVVLLPETKKAKLSVLDTFIHVYRKFFKKDKTYKSKQKAALVEQYYIDFLKQYSEQFDYALVIRPDLLSLKVIKEIKSKSNLIAAYQWDGLHRFPQVIKLINEFDRFFVFDIRDIKLFPQCKPITNFYFDDMMSPVPIKNDVYFVGTFMKNRITEIENLASIFSKLNLKVKILLQVEKKSKIGKYLKNGVQYVEKPLNFKENIENLKESNIVLDFKNDVHYGLSFRTFEALGFQKKLITNNEIVKEYDFFHDNNILIIKDFSKKEISEFIQQPFWKSDPRIIEKYSFTNWIKVVLDIHPHEPIIK